MAEENRFAERPELQMENRNVKETLRAFAAQEAGAAELLRALEREYLYVPIERVSIGKAAVDLPVYVNLSDGSRCIAVFSSDTVIDSAFYQKHTWKRMGYLELEKFVLGQSERHNVILDPYSDSPVMLRADRMEQIAGSHASEKSTDRDATLDTEIGEYGEAVNKAKVLFPIHRAVRRVYALVYQTGEEKSLCLVVDADAKKDQVAEALTALFQDLYRLLGPQVPLMILSYSELRNEIRQLGASPCYERKE